MGWHWPWWKPKPQYRALPGWPAAAADRDRLAEDLRIHLLASLYAVRPRDRQFARWAMSGSWLVECKRLAEAELGEAAGSFYVPAAQPPYPVVLGLPVLVCDWAGPPHLESRVVPRSARVPLRGQDGEPIGRTLAQLDWDDDGLKVRIVHADPPRKPGREPQECEG